MVASYSCALLLAATSAGQLPHSGETVLLDFSSPVCPPCRQMEPLLHRLAAEGYPIRHVDVTRDHRLAARFRVTRTPTFVLLVNGRETGRVVGAISSGNLKEMLHRSGVRPPGQSRQVPRGQSPDAPFDRRGRTPRAPSQVGRTNPPSRQDGRPSGAMPTAAQPGGQEASFARLIHGSVRLKVEDATGFSHGTGTIIHSDGRTAYVLTCGHLFRESRGQSPIEVDLFEASGRQATKVATVPGQLLHYDLEREIGILQMKPPYPVQAVPLADLQSPLQPGDRCASVGCDAGKAPTLWQSRIVSIDRYEGPSNIEASGAPVQGRSGGGLFDGAGRLIGVCYAADERANEGLYAGLRSIHGELKRARILQRMGRQRQPRAAQPLVATLPGPAAERPASVGSAAATGAALGNRAAGSLAPNSAPRSAELSPAELAVVEEIAQRANGAEVICIIRPNRPDARSEIITIENASPQLVSLVSQSGDRVATPRLTAHTNEQGRPEVRRGKRASTAARPGIQWSSKRR